MPVIELAAFAEPPRAAGPLVGLDVGGKTIGVAISDAGRLIASPTALIRKVKFTRDAEALFALLEDRGATGLVIGLPLNMDGSEGPRCQASRAFARNLMRLRDLPIAFWDERLSTAGVERMLVDEFDASRARRREAVDKLAASWILQGALDRLRLNLEAGRPAPAGRAGDGPTPGER